jgi:hypothetical protein
VSEVRLTRRGRLLLTTLPLFLVVAAGVQALANHGAPDQHPQARTAATASPTPTTTPTPKPTPSHHPTPTPPHTTPPPARTGYTGNGTFAVAPGSSGVHGTGPLLRFTVEVERGLPDTPASFAAAVERTLFDPRGWAGNGRLSLQRVSSGPVAFHVVLASPATTDRLCLPLITGRVLSCFQHGRSVLNAMRWHDGASAYAGDLAGYRIYMVNHEVGHALGHGHRFSCGAGGLAYVMIQQTKGLLGCRKNPWPLAAER